MENIFKDIIKKEIYDNPQLEEKYKQVYKDLIHNLSSFSHVTTVQDKQRLS